MQQVKDWILFVRALRRATWWACVESGIGVCFSRGWGMVKALWPWPRSKYDPDMARRRMEVCENCDFYVARYKTCGSPNSGQTWHNPMSGKNELVGCFCFMPYKAKIPNAKCWASEQSDDMIGWGAELCNDGKTECDEQQSGDH